MQHTVIDRSTATELVMPARKPEDVKYSPLFNISLIVGTSVVAWGFIIAGVRFVAF